MSEQLELPLVVDQIDTLTVDASSGDVTAKKAEQPLSERDFKMAMKRAYAERAAKIKQNKVMLEEMNLEVDYWKAQSDLLKYRFEKMDYFLKNLEIEPRYLAAVAEQQAQVESTEQKEQSILS